MSHLNTIDQDSSEYSLWQFKNSCTIVVCGASGDLATKKTFPALYELFKDGLLPRKTRILGYARTKMSNDEFRKRATSKFQLNGSLDEQKSKEFVKMLEYVHGSYDKDEDFQHLEEVIQDGEKELGSQDGKYNRLFYLALPPSVFGELCEMIRKNCWLGDKGYTRVIIEKPFGHDLESSRALQKEIGKVLTEDEVYRIDHYLGKEMVKNILIYRFANLFMSACWNRQYIKTVQITFKEPFGTEGRGGYFDDIGIIRDVMQNHLCQVMCLVAMERPVSFSPEDIRDEKVKVLKAAQPIRPQDVLLGQYTKSEDGSKPGYLDDDTIKDKNSVTPTYAAIHLRIQNERWDGVPFILKAGKALNESKVEIRLQLRQPPGGIFRGIAPNELVLRVQPSEAIYMKINAKYPGLGTETVTSDMDFTYHRRFTNLHIPQAYESLILDCLNGDHSNFVRDDELDEAWKLFTPILHKIEEGKVPLEKYAYGTRGPAGVDQFVDNLGYVHSQSNYSWPVTAGVSRATTPSKF